MKIKIKECNLCKAHYAVSKLFILQKNWLKIIRKHKKNNDCEILYNVTYVITKLKTLDVYSLYNYEQCKQLAIALLYTKKAIRSIYANDDCLYQIFVNEAENILKLLDEAFNNKKLDLINTYNEYTYEKEEKI